MKEQKRAMQQETFERTFFHLLEAISECYHSTEYHKFEEISPEISVGRHREDILKKYGNVNSPDSIIVSESFNDIDGMPGVNVITKGDTAFVSAIRNNMGYADSMYLEPYFFLIFSALKLAHQIKFCETFEEKKFYTDILRSQMPNCGVQALCMYLASNPPELDGDRHHGKVFKKLIKKYALFANMRGPNLVKDYVLQYKRSAFGNNRPDIDKIFETTI